MKNNINKRVVLVLALCMACVLGFGVTFAQADGDEVTTGSNNLTVGVAIPQADLADAPIEIKAYRIATGSKDSTSDTYNYTFDVAAFASLEDDYNALASDSRTTTEQWDNLAAAAKAIVDQNSDLVADGQLDASGETMSGLRDGIYLVLVSDTQNATQSFTFKPALVALPGKVGADNTPVYQTADGEWTSDVAIMVKGSMSPRFGSLVINKDVNDFDGEPATFVYLITDIETGGSQYSNYAAVQYTAEGTQSTTVGHIPAGMDVVVTEVDSGARYQVVGSATAEATIVADDTQDAIPASVSFTNEPNNSGTVGYGVENHYVYNDGDWTVSQRTINASA